MSCPTTALSADEIKRELQGLVNWHFSQNALERIYEGKTYLDSLEKLNRIARLSEAADHHPDLTLNWKTLTVRYWTHTAKGITELDFRLAHQVEEVLR